MFSENYYLLDGYQCFFKCCWFLRISSKLTTILLKFVIFTNTNRQSIKTRGFLMLNMVIISNEMDSAKMFQ
ncbi:hypothetical protein DERP_011034 [Dermatophagoides pteronyssinus]|uniref:Uncharacterized protein n=1 Tax=Dermatophagoides pteronyssinus TaxID=6956 RepID=A0ABQ8JVG9_DERPT|nr:hypothetical protein DERP_011034 [Dermatophagoides pteronyssinus]